MFNYVRYTKYALVDITTIRITKSTHKEILKFTQKTVNLLCAPSLDSENQMKKTMVTLALKNTLLELGIQEYDKVVSLLQKDYSCTLEDCYENPEYLRNILKDLFGDSYPDILSSLSENMKNILSQPSVKDFLQVLST